MTYTHSLDKLPDPEGDTDLPPGFMAELVEALKREDERWHPVTERRITNWMAARVHSRMIETIFIRGEARGLFKVETRYSHHQGPLVPPAEFRVLLLPNREDI